ncbi:MAG TPA: YtxH domain-containing protein [Candidatus Limnocylindrales bacterium]|nr:YtxH domain-containing protein [Candidatus Limnocylindrales bacterium]
MSDNPYLNDVPRSGTMGVSGFVLGAIVGAGVALLFAPAAGGDTRRRLGETAKKIGSAAKDKIQDGKDQARGYIESGRQAFESGRKSFEDARQGFESGHDRRGTAGAGSTPGQAANRTAPGKPGAQGSTYTP